MRSDSETGYCHQFEVYLGKEHNRQNGKPIGQDVVERLTEKLHGQKHHVYYDSFFSSVALAESLLSHQLYSCGTIVRNRKGFPNDLKNTPRMAQGDFVAR